MCDFVHACLLWFPTYNDLLVENLRFHRFCTSQSRLKPSHWVTQLGPRMSVGIKKLVSVEPDGKNRVILRSLVSSEYQLSATKNQTHVITHAVERHVREYGKPNDPGRKVCEWL